MASLSETLLNYGLIHILLIGTLFYMFGFVYGCIAIYVSIMAIDKIMNRLGYTRLNSVDYAHTFNEEVRNNNICGYFEIEKLKFKEFKHRVINRTFDHIKKMSQIRVNILGVYFWKDISKDMAKEQIFRIEDKLESDEDVVSY